MPGLDQNPSRGGHHVKIREEVKFPKAHHPGDSTKYWLILIQGSDPLTQGGSPHCLDIRMTRTTVMRMTEEKGEVESPRLHWDPG